uniref:HMG box domain-containing protein n=1 Tax=Panagrolaimus sp. PS1159 TaxID=55785 RepID=A0AC35FRA4_9BILA
MFRAIVNFRIGALIQSNVIGRNYTSKPSNSKPSKQVLPYRYCPFKPWILFLRDFLCEDKRKIFSKLWKGADKEPYIYMNLEYEDQFFKDTNHPRDPVKPHEMYFQEKHPGKSRRNAKYAKYEFDKLSDEEKQPFIDKYNEERKSYLNEFKKWKEIHGEACNLFYKEKEKMRLEIEILKGELNDCYYKYKDDL